MKFVFGILSLLIVLGVVASVARQQAQAVSRGTAVQPAESASPGAQTVAGQARGIEQKAREDMVQALKKGSDRNASVDP